MDLVASGVAYKERLNMPVIAEAIAREQPEHLRAYFMERLRHYRQVRPRCRAQAIRCMQK